MLKVIQGRSIEQRCSVKQDSILSSRNSLLISSSTLPLPQKKNNYERLGAVIAEGAAQQRSIMMINLKLRLPNAPHVPPSTSSNSYMLKGQLITMKKLEDAPTERNSKRTNGQKATLHDMAPQKCTTLQLHIIYR